VHFLSYKYSGSYPHRYSGQKGQDSSCNHIFWQCQTIQFSEGLFPHFCGIPKATDYVQSHAVHQAETQGERSGFGVRYDGAKHKTIIGPTKRKKVRTVDFGDTQDIPADYNEISFVCLRPDGCLETPSTLSIVCRTLAKKLDGFEGFHFRKALGWRAKDTPFEHSELTEASLNARKYSARSGIVYYMSKAFFDRLQNSRRAAVRAYIRCC